MKMFVATGKFSSNFKAEVEALTTAAISILSEKSVKENVVLLTDALSVISTIKSHRDKNPNELRRAVNQMFTMFKRFVVQWIPSHCGIPGNEAAEILAKDGSRLPQTDISTTYEEAKTLTKMSYCSKWTKEHPGHHSDDAYYKLNREDQVIIFTLRTGHNMRINYL
jgi:ribonuclease HI